VLDRGAFCCLLSTLVTKRASRCGASAFATACGSKEGASRRFYADHKGVSSGTPDRSPTGSCGFDRCSVPEGAHGLGEPRVGGPGGTVDLKAFLGLLGG
jgi:hypothetical protein